MLRLNLIAGRFIRATTLGEAFVTVPLKRTWLLLVVGHATGPWWKMSRARKVSPWVAV
jgi:hypothetical protein